MIRPVVPNQSALLGRSIARERLLDTLIFNNASPDHRRLDHYLFSACCRGISPVHNKVSLGCGLAVVGEHFRGLSVL